MQILWATPFNKQSAIGTYSREVCHELVERGHSVRIMRLEGGAEARWPPQSTFIPTLGSDDPVPPDVDLVVVNYGNHAAYHAGALRLAAEQHCVAIFHDAEMRDFQWGMLHRHRFSIPILPRGDGARDTRTADFDLVDPDARPLLETLSAMAAGAIVHGPHYQPTVMATCPGPVEIMPLCFPESKHTAIQRPRDGKRRVVIFGVISRYKQPDRLLRAVSKLKAEFGTIDVHLAGEIQDEYRSTLTGLAEQLNVPAPIFHGYLSDQELSNVLAASDAICCLRYPVTEGGSASLIMALYQGRPLVVSNIASYSMVPDELVCKISCGEDVDDLVDGLRRIFENTAAAEAIAAKGRDWARRTYSASSYVDKLEQFIDRVMDSLPVQQACRQLAGRAILPDGNASPSALFSIAKAANSLFTKQKIGDRLA